MCLCMCSGPAASDCACRPPTWQTRFAFCVYKVNWFLKILFSLRGTPKVVLHGGFMNDREGYLRVTLRCHLIIKFCFKYKLVHTILMCFCSLLYLRFLNKLAQPLAHSKDLSSCDFNVFVCLKLFLVHKCKSQLYKNV